MKPSSAKNKGRIFQQFVVSALLKAFPTLKPGDVRSTSMGAPGEDILLSPRAEETIAQFKIECKKQEAAGPLYRWFEQAQSHCTVDGDMPLLIASKNHELPLVVLKLEHLIKLLQK